MADSDALQQQTAWQPRAFDRDVRAADASALNSDAPTTAARAIDKIRSLLNAIGMVPSRDSPRCAFETLAQFMLGAQSFEDKLNVPVAAFWSLLHVYLFVCIVQGALILLTAFSRKGEAMTARLLIGVLFISTAAAGSAWGSAPDDPWKPYEFLIGQWTGEGGGEPGKGSGEFSFAWDLQKFEMAPPGKSDEFKTYLEGSARRQDRPKSGDAAK
jgi:hypothetical protein